MTHYACFTGQEYEPQGGWNDLVGIADSLEAAKALAEPPDKYDKYWAHIVILDDNPRVISFKGSTEYRDLKRRLKAETWYDEGSAGWIAHHDEATQFSDLEPFEPHLVQEWHQYLERTQHAS